MDIVIFNWRITIERIDSNPLKNITAQQVEKLAKTFSGYGHHPIGTKISRIKSLREIAQKRYRYTIGLAVAKDWVDSNFSDK